MPFPQRRLHAPPLAPVSPPNPNSSACTRRTHNLVTPSSGVQALDISWNPAGIAQRAFLPSLVCLLFHPTRFSLYCAKQARCCCYFSTLKCASHHSKPYSPGVSFPLSSVLGILREKGKEPKVRASVQLLLKFSQPVVLSAKWRLNRNSDKGIKILEKDRVSIQKFFIN